MKKSEIFLISIILFLTGCSSVDDSSSYSVRKGDFIASQIETGELVAVNSVGIQMPFIGWKYGWRYKIIELAEHGDKVPKGEFVAKIDPSPVIKVLEEEQNNLEIELANLKKTKANHQSQLSQLNTELAREKANLDLIKLQVDKFKFEPEQKQNIKSLELEIAEIKLNRVKRKIELKTIVIENELNIQEIKIDQIKNSIIAAEIAVKKLELVSPIEGIVQLKTNRRTRKRVQLGDEVHQGRQILSIPDMSKMKANAIINETDIYKIKLGQKVNIRLDAYPEKIFTGDISYIGKLSREKDEDDPIRVFDFEVSIIENDPALKPGMTVSCEVILSELKNSLFVSNECVFQEKSEFYIIPKDKKNDRLPVEILGRNNEYTAIKGEVSKGRKLLTRSEISNSNI